MTREKEKSRQKQRRRTLKAVLGLTTLLAFVQTAKSVTTSTGIDELSMIRFRNETTNKLGGLSLMGGAEIMIDGTGFDSQAPNHLIKFKSQNTGLTEMTLIGPAMSDDDAFSSSSLGGKLAYTTPAVTSLFNAPLDAFSGTSQALPAGTDRNNPGLAETIKFEMFVYNTADKLDIKCTETNIAPCQVNYHVHYTPYLVDTVPSQVYKDQPVTFVMNPVYATHNTNILNTDMDPVQSMKIGGSNTDFEGLIDSSTRPTRYAISGLRSVVGDQKPGKRTDPQLQFRVGNALNLPSAEHCNFAGTECWHTRTQPVIDSIDKVDGYTTGGQTLKITGSGFEGQATVMVDGVACQVTSSQEDVIHCVTGKATKASFVGVNQPGSPGMTLKEIDPSDVNAYVGWSNLENMTPIKTSVATSIEHYSRGKDRYGLKYDGWFKAPETGNYKFYLACDDVCRMNMDATNAFNAADPTSVTQTPVNIAYKNWCHWRDFFNIRTTAPSDKNSDWVSLAKGEFYKMDVEFIDHNHGDYLSTAVEFEMADTSANPKNAAYEVQRLAITHDHTFEEWQINIVNPDSKTVQLAVAYKNAKDPSKIDLRTFQAVKANASAHSWYLQLRWFYWDRWGSNISVTKKNYDAQDAETTVSADIVKSVINVKVSKLLKEASFTQASLLNKLSASTISVTAPSQATLSTVPIQGKYVIECPDEAGTVYKFPAHNYHASRDMIQMDTIDYIPHLRYKTHVIRRNNFEGYTENGVEFLFYFNGYTGNVPQCTIKSDDTTPITGGANLQFTSETLREAGTNLWFEPIPMEFLATNEQKPQVLLSVNGLDAVCRNKNCDYAYTDATATVTSQTLAGVKLTIQGTDLPTADAIIGLAQATCVSTTVVSTATQIECDLNEAPAAGEWDVQIVTPKGLIPIDAAATVITVELVIDSITPGANLNQLGGDILKIAGTGFSPDLTSNEVIFDDNTGCTIKQTSATMLDCEVDGFDAAQIKTTDYQVTVKSKQKDKQKEKTNNTKSVTVNPVKYDGVSVTPTSVSPVLKTDLTVAIMQTFPGSMSSAADFSAKLVKKDDPTTTLPLYVISVDSAAKTLKIKFPGAPSGVYLIQLTHKTEGRIDKVPLEITTEGKITAISATSGSVLGGQMLDISGVNFSTDKLDNPVKVGAHYCLVKESTPTKISCQIEGTRKAANAPDEDTNVTVFLRTSEEAVVETGASNAFKYTTPVATITGLTAAFDSATNAIKVTVAGSGFIVDDLSAVKLYIDKKLQNTVKVTASDAEILISDMLDKTSADMEIVMPDGYPIGFDGTFMQSISIDPTLTSVTAAKTCIGGSLIHVQGTGFGVNTKEVQLYHQETSQTVCQEVTELSYGSFMCLTKPMPINPTDTLKLQIGTTQYDCANTLDAAKCKIAQEPAGSPHIHAVALTSPTQITFTGVEFDSTFTGRAIFKGLSSTSVTINSPTEAVAEFAGGVPASEPESAPQLRFEKATEKIVCVAENPQDQVKLAVPSAVGSATSNLVCSFAGGCAYEIQGPGLTSSLQTSTPGIEKNRVDVCGQECVFDLANSDAQKAVCTLPALPTQFSANNLSIVEASSMVNEGVWSGTAAQSEIAKLFDGKDNNMMNDSTSANCHFQIAFKPNYVGVMSRLEFFIKDLVNNTPYIDGNVLIQGSNDGTTFTEILRLDANIHSGWNTQVLPEGARPSYNIYRWQGKVNGSCAVGEIRMHGVVAINDANPTYQCTPTLVLDGQTQPLSPVTYDNAVTPVLTGMSTRFGSVLGGETVTFTGTGFSDTAATTVMIDNRPCDTTGQTQTATAITCVTADKPFKPDEPSLVINIAGAGNVATKGLVFRYVSKWSSPQTWGYDLAPLAGEAINIPKGMHLLVDVDSTPILSFVVVEGSLIFEPHPTDENHQRTFDAKYVMVRNGYFEAGTNQFPYTSKLTITMHSQITDPYLPIYGNKVIGVRFGTIELHGKPRSKTWTQMDVTAEAGATQITLMEAVDWQVGEQIAIASTDFSGRNTEQRTITAISNSSTKPLVTLDQPLVHKHYAAVYTAGGESIEMRAEVGLLTRNLKFQGDPETSAKNQYGAHIMIHSPGDESSVGRIENTEFFNCGQAFKLGRYPIHFHMIGTVTKSYVRNNAVHHTYNRAVTIHGVHYLAIQNNVAYLNMGHAIFIEDAAETNQLIEDNLIMDTRRSWSLLNTDQTPASFWITHPNNILRRNHAAGSDRYSYWYDTQKNAMGPSFDLNVCPENSKIGEFVDNVAHSNGRYGLRIFHNLIPREFPCKPFTYSGNPADPYPTNKPIIANFRNLVAWKNGRNGAIAERVGAVQFHDFKVADNILAGMEFSLSEDIIDGYAKIVGGVAFGKTDNGGSEMDNANTHGVITTRTENFGVEGVKFVNFDFNKAAALGDCSHCFHPAATDSGARHYTVKGLKFDDATVPRRIRHQLPWRGIWRDEDGSLTGTGQPGWAVAYHKHLEQPECVFDAATRDKFEGVICNNDVQVRRIIFYNYSPKHFDNLPINILPYEYTTVQAKKADGSYDAWVKSASNYARVDWKSKGKPENSWAVPYVTGHRYKIHWGSKDFERMDFDLSEKWLPTDKPIMFNTNFTETREAINMTMRRAPKTQIAEGTINELYVRQFLAAGVDFQTGDNYLMNDTAIREFEWAINGKNPEKDLMRMTGLKCLTGVCDLTVVEEVELEAGQRLWSDVKSWDGRTELPKEGESIEIPSGVNMLLDLAETPILGRLEINGRLTFKNDMDIHLQAKLIWVRAGELFIGNSTNPYTYKGKITLHGGANDETLVVSPSVSAYNKVLANTGTVEIYGVERSRDSRLQLPVNKGDTQLYLTPGLDWVAGDQIYLAPTAMQQDHSDYATLESYDKGSGIATLAQPLNYYHFGTGSSTKLDYGVDMRGEVVLLNRNIMITGTETDDWGCQVFTTDIIDGATFRNGKTTLKNIEIYRGGQRDTFRAAIRFEGSLSGSGLIENVVSHHSSCWHMNLVDSANIVVNNFSGIKSKAIGVSIDKVRNVQMKGTYVFDVPQRSTAKDVSNKVLDKESCFLICTHSKIDGSPCPDISVQDSIVAGCHYAGIQSPGSTCGDINQTKFRNNVAHSNKGSGLVIYIDPTDSSQKKCLEGNNNFAYKNLQAGIEGVFETEEYRITNVKLIDNQLGLSIATAGHKDYTKTRITDSTIYGESSDIAKDCPGQIMDCYCPEKGGFMLTANQFKPKDAMILSASGRPMHKTKTESSLGGTTEIDNVEFKNFKHNTLCGGKQTIFFRNEHASDYLGPHYVTNSRFTDVDDSGFYYMAPAPEKWATIDDCGEWPCTAPANTLMTFTGSSFSGTTPGFQKRDFEIVPKNVGVSDKYEGCTEVSGSNMSVCDNRNLAMFVFESLDGDTYDRSVQPITITSEETGYSNKLNSQMDHVWDGFYTGQTRRSSFSAQIEAGHDYTLTFTGTPPGSMKYELLHDQTDGIKIKIPYPNAGSYQVKVNGNLVKPTGWDEALGRNKPLAKQKCGENRFVGIENFLEFYLTKDCKLTVSPLDAIKTKVRMEWTLEAFYAEGGVTRFADRIAASLGIDASRVKTVAVYEGSVIVDFFIEAILGDPEPVKALEQIKEVLVEVVATGVANLGAPLLGLEGDDELLAGDPIPAAGGAAGAQEILGTDSKAIVKDDKNLWDVIVAENAEVSKKQAEADAKRNSVVVKQVTKIIENSRFKDTPVRNLAMVILFVVLILTVALIYLLCRCMQRREDVLKVQDEVRVVKENMENQSIDLDPQFGFEDDTSKNIFGQREQTTTSKKDKVITIDDLVKTSRGQSSSSKSRSDSKMLKGTAARIR